MFAYFHFTFTKCFFLSSSYACRKPNFSREQASSFMLKLEKSEKEAVADDDEVPAKNAHTLSPSRLLFHKYIIIIHV